MAFTAAQTALMTEVRRLGRHPTNLLQGRAAEFKERNQIFAMHFQEYVAGTRPCPPWLLPHLPSDFDLSPHAPPQSAPAAATQSSRQSSASPAPSTSRASSAAPAELRHAAHPHPLTLEAPNYRWGCDVCMRKEFPVGSSVRSSCSLTTKKPAVISSHDITTHQPMSHLSLGSVDTATQSYHCEACKFDACSECFSKVRHYCPIYWSRAVTTYLFITLSPRRATQLRLPTQPTLPSPLPRRPHHRRRCHRVCPSAQRHHQVRTRPPLARRHFNARWRSLEH